MEKLVYYDKEGKVQLEIPVKAGQSIMEAVLENDRLSQAESLVDWITACKEAAKSSDEQSLFLPVGKDGKLIPKKNPTSR